MDLPIENGDFPYVSLPEGISTNLGIGLGQQNGDRQHNVNKFLKSNMIPPPPSEKKGIFVLFPILVGGFKHFLFSIS